MCKLPDNRKCIDCKWVYKIKENTDGIVDSFKARLVAKGFTQVFGLDYGETFSPVVKYDSIRTLFAFAVHKGMLLQQFDIKTAFLYCELEEDLYMFQPPGYIMEKNMVCKLNRFLIKNFRMFCIDLV